MKKYKNIAIAITILICVAMPIGKVNANEVKTTQDTQYEANDIVNIPDYNLKKAINKQLGKVALLSDITKEEMKSLTVLRINAGYDPRNNISDLTGLETAVNLTELGLNGHSIEDINPLSNLTNLNELDVSANKITDITPIANLTNLSYLNVNGNQITSLNGIQNLENLIELNVSSDILKDLTPIKDLTNLKTLTISGSNVSDISIIDNLVNLEHLSINSTNVEDISALKNLTKLNELFINNCKVKDISALSNLTNLKMLDLAVNNIEDIRALSNMNNLECLQLRTNKVKDLTPLINLSNLSSLDVAANSIQDLRALKKMPNLTYADLFKQKIQLSKITTSNGEVIMEIPKVYDIEGALLKPTNYFGGSGYEIYNNNVIWKNINENIDVGVTFKSIATVGNNDDLEYSVTFTQPVVAINDITGHWAEASIRDFINKGYINGYPDNTFKPNNSITRAEFVKIFNRKFGLTTTSGKVFNDTIYNWAKNEIDIAVTNGVCNGMSATEFKPNDPITREQAAVMIANYKKIADSTLDKLNKYQDVNEVSSWAKDSVEGVIENGYMGAGGIAFNPKNNITRAETAVALGRIN
jgi:Leucine-rich repeat (LRR) protein